MHYMMLIYSKESMDQLSEADAHRIRLGHRSLIQEATAKGVLIGAEPLAPASTATTLRFENGKRKRVLIPFRSWP